MDRHTKYEREEKKTVHLGEDARKKTNTKQYTQKSETFTRVASCRECAQTKKTKQQGEERQIQVDMDILKHTRFEYK